MERTTDKTMRRARWAGAAVAAVFALIVAAPAQADKPARAGGGKKAGKGVESRVNVQISERQQTIIRTYFGGQARAGHCPPGLARKNNGCMPPGQAKKWQLGRPLPRDVIFHDLPPRLAVDLGPPPSGYRFVRVAEDILLIAVGTGMVLDAVKDIGRVLDR